jgi:predicted nucleic acid-binding protein
MFYCDTSALMKLYVQEPQTDFMQRLCANSDTVVISDITWVEMRSALALRVRTNQTSKVEAESALAKLRAEWLTYQALSLDASLFELAGDHTEAFGLRAYDSVQLASAQRFNIALRGQMTFCCFDKALNNAAKILGMKVLDI